MRFIRQSRRPIEFLGFVGASPFTEVEEWSGQRSSPSNVREARSSARKPRVRPGSDRVLRGRGRWLATCLIRHPADRAPWCLGRPPSGLCSAPTLAARFASTLDIFARSVALHIVTGGSEADQVSDGDFLPKEQRYERTSEYLDILRKSWTEPRPFDYHGNYYHVEGVNQQVRPYQEHGIPVFFGGSSSVALDIAARKADLYAFFGEPVAEIRERIAECGLAPSRTDVMLGYSVSLAADPLARRQLERARGFPRAAFENGSGDGSAHKMMRAGAKAPKALEGFSRPAIRSRISATGSPKKAYRSAFRAAMSSATEDEPPKKTGMPCSWYGRTC